MNNKTEINELMLKSEQSINASVVLFKNNYYDFSAGRSYYAMFYTIEALLLSKNLSYSKHSAVISSFGKEFIKTGIFDIKFHQYLIKAFDLRNSGDYGTMNSISREEAEKLIDQAKELLETVKEYLINK